MERTVVLSDGEVIEPSDLPLEAMGPPPDGAAGEGDGAEGPLNDQLERLERELITRAMEQARGVKTRAAQILGIKTSALYYKLEKYGVAYEQR